MNEIDAFERAMRIRDRVENLGSDEHDPFADAKQPADTAAFLTWWIASMDERHQGAWMRWPTVWATYLEYCWFEGFRPLTERKLQRDLGRHGILKRRLFVARVVDRKPTVYLISQPSVTLEQTWEIAA